LRCVNTRAAAGGTVARMTGTTSHAALLQRFDQPGPRYTSYPTADRFAEHIGTAEALAALRQRGQFARAGSAPPLALYVHIPFCESVCYYCACNKVVTRRHERGAEYLDALTAEVALAEDALGTRQAVHQLHLGGGTPTFLSDDELTRLLTLLRRAFDIAPGAEMSIEVDPRSVDRARLAHLAALGFNRISLGVQDFDPAVQQAVHRIQPHAQVQALMRAAREIGFESINVDLIYGLPRQTEAGFARTVAQVAQLRPDRIALYAYAHLPQRFAPQRRIHDHELPDAATRVALLGGAVAGFLAQGYVYIGMDHFALPGDALAVAQREGRLQRNFQGYTVGSGGQADDLLALGVSAISQVGGVYWQNAKTLPEYQLALQQGRLPAVRGLASSAEDDLRRDLIMALMCHGRVDLHATAQRHGVAALHSHLAPELARLRGMAEAGVLTLEGDPAAPTALQVSAAGWYVVRAIAMVFDQHLPTAHEPRRFSRVL